MAPQLAGGVTLALSLGKAGPGQVPTDPLMKPPQSAPQMYSRRPEIGQSPTFVRPMALSECVGREPGGG